MTNPLKHLCLFYSINLIIIEISVFFRLCKYLFFNKFGKSTDIFTFLLINCNNNMNEANNKINTWPVMNPLHWGINGTVTHKIGANGTVKLDLKPTTNQTIDDKTIDLSEDKKQIPLNKFIDKYVPGLANADKYKLDKKLFTGYLQTMYLGAANFGKSFPVFYGREIVKFNDNGICSADWVMNNQWEDKYQFKAKDGKFNLDQFKIDAQETHPENWPRLHPRTRFLNSEELSDLEIEHRDTNKPLVVVLHGLAGGSHEPIIRSLTNHLSKVDDGKFQVVVLNTRGCARSKISTRALFTAFHYMDIDEFLNREYERNPNRKIYAIGCSFGATMLSNYLGFVGDKSPLSAAAVLCNPWDMVLACEKISNDFWSQKLFSQNITQFLVRMVKVNMKELEVPEGTKPDQEPSVEHPSYLGFTQTNLKKAFKFTKMEQFDSMFTAPALGFKDAMDYYSHASPVNRFDKITVPLLSINAMDDPIIGDEHILKSHIDANPNVMVIETDLGGHLAYLQEDGDSWATRKITDFINAFDKLVV